ncbi:amidase [Lichenifustis flavocetrariae]|uniref:Indoleacetamide hydrolase n=1 Tax=Lichenifustis flavocetrariae TaxID=2949735 RepID=A0AA42CMF3_9HYPH|nr:amidase [Lichenifustis flavocetrariae]MCW6508285.1 amidase [Lichenifustis flavocetrariae]
MTGAPDFTGRSALQIAAVLAAGTVDAVAVADATLKGIADCPDKAVFTATMLERARREAAASAVRHRDGRPLSLLDGVPVAWKDLFDLQGEVTRAGSLVLDDGAADADAALVTRLAEAGMVTVGKVNMTEFAYSGLGLNPHYGTPVNPWSRDEPRAPGGSSSGSAVAVALGLVPIAIGSDTGGSVRIPAAFNGVIGYKSSGGRWPLAGGFPLSRTLDTAGVLCRSVVDAVLVDAAARGLAAPDLRRGSLKGLRLIVPTNVIWDGIEPAVAQNFEAALARMVLAGAIVDRRVLPSLDAVLALSAKHGALAALEAYDLHKERLATEAPHRMDRRVVARLRAGAAIGAAAEATIRAARPQMIAELAPIFDGSTLIAFPTVPHVAPKIAALEADDDLFVATNLKTLRNTLIGNFLDWCGVSIPTGFDASGLPTALLLSGGPGRDDHLLATALAAEPVIRDATHQTDPR